MSTYTAAGIVMDRYADVLARIHAVYIAKYGDSIDLDTDAWDGHLSELIALLVGEMNDIIQDISDGRDISNSSGVALDAAISFLGLSRQGAAKSVIVDGVQLTANKATTVPAGSRYGTVPDVVFTTDAELVIPAAGTGLVSATCTEDGAFEVAIGELTQIKSSVPGITAVTNTVAAIPGRLRQTDSEVKAAHALAVATTGEDDVSSIYEALNGVDGVSGIFVFENDTGATASGIPAYTVYVVVIGGSDADVAAAISANKTSGVPTFGSESDTVYNEVTRQTKTIYFDRGAGDSIYIALNITKVSTQFPDDGEVQIINNLAAIYDAKRLGDDVIYNEHWGAIYSVPGLIVNTLKVDTIPIPVGTSDIVMTPQQLASLDTVRDPTTNEITSINVTITES